MTPVLRFEQSSFYSKGDQYWSQAYTAFTGRMEVVDPHAENKFYVAKCFTDGAYLSLSQLTNIPESDCNGGKGRLRPIRNRNPIRSNSSRDRSTPTASRTTGRGSATTI